ncbi:hypothetical protein PIB30_067940 [Stylosanthes scabra]|uniref:Uncharacterized protein n=1 Tax=Stylosanthes scabra TaxID=79078 RepID=A0ABU6VNQ8_9FABA|nr:hypothetical protein [Stylosanthes scabra]
MAKKKVQEPESKGKGKKDKTIKRPDKRSNSRCTPLKFRKIYDPVSDAKKQLIVEMGLGAFAHLLDFYINHKLLIEPVRSYDAFTNTISTSAREFFIV